jgi:hypothetical protein
MKLCDNRCWTSSLLGERKPGDRVMRTQIAVFWTEESELAVSEQALC